MAETNASSRFPFRLRRQRANHPSSRVAHKNEFGESRAPQTFASPVPRSEYDAQDNADRTDQKHSNRLESAQLYQSFHSEKKLRKGVRILLHAIQRFAPRVHQTRLGSALYGNTFYIQAESDWMYDLRQGCEKSDLRAVRQQMEPRLSRKGAVLQGPSWAHLLLRENYAPLSPSARRHKLRYKLMECCCLKCLIHRVKDEQDCPSIDTFEADCVADTNSENLENASSTSSDKNSVCGENREGTSSDPPAIDPRTLTQDTEALTSSLSIGYKAAEACPVGKLTSVMNRVSDDSPGLSRNASASVSCELPVSAELSLLGASPNTTLHVEIGVLTKLHNRAKAKFTLSSTMRQFVVYSGYVGKKSVADVCKEVLRVGREYYDLHKGKRERRVYLECETQAFYIPLSVLLIEKSALNDNEQGARAVIAREQVIRIFHGAIVLEGSIGTHIPTNIPWYIGYGEDNAAQAVFPDGRLGPPRAIGINELCLHTNMFDNGDTHTLVLG